MFQGMAKYLTTAMAKRTLQKLQQRRERMGNNS